MRPKTLRDKEIEAALEEVCGLPDTLLSEDDLESDEEEAYNAATLQRVLEETSDSPDSPVPCSSRHPTSDERSNNSGPLVPFPDTRRGSVETPVLPEEESSESEESEVDDDTWTKRLWISRPDPEEFDEVSIKPQYLFNRRFRPVAHMNKFFNDEVYDLIVTQTNLYAEQSRIGNWRPVDKRELQAFFGILIIMGYHVLPTIDLYWSSDPGFRVNEVADVMPVKRFKQILRALHLNDNSQQPGREDPNFDKLYKLRPLISLLNNAFQTNANNSSSQSIDESMILFKGRSSLKQYMPLKPIKRGYKVWCRCDSSTGYLYENEIYTGKSGQGTEEGLGAKVVKNLSEKLMEEDFTIHVTFDNFFCDRSLLQHLHENDVFATGTVRRNRADLPKIIKKSTNTGRKKSLKLANGEFKWRTKQDVSFIVWQDTKEVLVLTTAFHPKIGKTTVQRTQKDGSKLAVQCPRAIKEYTKRMGGVDKFDQLKAPYSVGRRSKRWWLRIFYFYLDACLTNAFILYSLSSRVEKLTNLEFRVAVARGLIGGYSSRKRKSTSIPTYVTKKLRLADSENYQKTVNAVPIEIRHQNVGEHMPGDLPSYRRCKLCSTKTNDKRSKIQCLKCLVPLCITPCSIFYHKFVNLICRSLGTVI